MKNIQIKGIEIMTLNQCAVPGGNIHYLVQNESSLKTPILVVHGGPGLCHDYLLSLTQLIPDHPIIYYDQLDCGLSDKPNDSSLWIIERFVQEIECLQKHLNIQSFILYGHSAGAMFALDYALRNANYLKGLILSAPVFNMRESAKNLEKVLNNYPEKTKSIFMQEHFSPDTVDRFDLMEARIYHGSRYFCRLPYWDDNLLEASQKRNIVLHDFMWGPSTFFITGTLLEYNRENELSSLKVKTLVSVGEYEMGDIVFFQKNVSKMQNAKLEIIANASHNPHIEEPLAYANVLNAFLQECE